MPQTGHPAAKTGPMIDGRCGNWNGAAMETIPLHEDFGVEVRGVHLREGALDDLYPMIRRLFDRHSLLLFRDQTFTDTAHMALARLFGPVEDRQDRPEPKISPVTNLMDDGEVVSGARDHRLLNLQANFLWHTDSTFLPAPALANILVARVLPSQGGNTEFVSTRAGFQRLSEEDRGRLRGTYFRHRYAHSRAKIDPELAKGALFTKWQDQTWRAVWTNPETGAESLYIASHAFEVVGMEASAGLAWIDALLEAMTPARAVYSHAWRPGDVLIWDERATLHRGTPWRYEEPRKLDSLCVTARDVDGLDKVRPAA